MEAAIRWILCTRERGNGPLLLGSFEVVTIGTSSTSGAWAWATPPATRSSRGSSSPPSTGTASARRSADFVRYARRMLDEVLADQERAA
jgi:hypothetical protein